MLVKRSLTLASHPTSVALEPEFWDALKAISRTRQLSLAQLIAEIDSSRDQGRGLAQALRVYALEWYRHRP